MVLPSEVGEMVQRGLYYNSSGLSQHDTNRLGTNGESQVGNRPAPFTRKKAVKTACVTFTTITALHSTSYGADIFGINAIYVVIHN